MATTRRQRYLLLAALSAVAVPALAESLGPQTLQLPAEIAGSPCTGSDPTDPHHVLGPTPARVDCLAALYAPLTASRYGAGDPDERQPQPSTGAHAGSESLTTTTVGLYLVGIAMLILAGFNSRKRRRHLPTVDLSRSFTPPAERRDRREGAGGHDD